MSFLQKNISAICQTLLEEHMADMLTIVNVQNNHAEQFIRRQLGQMPDYLKVPFGLLNLFFCIVILITYFRPFYRLSFIQQRKILSHWRQSKWDFCRTFLKFYETLIIYDLSFQVWNLQ